MKWEKPNPNLLRQSCGVYKDCVVVSAVIIGLEGQVIEGENPVFASRLEKALLVDR